MGYCFKHGEPVAHAIRRIVRDEIDSAIYQLKAGPDRDEAIHEARKSMKKIRAVLRLVRPQMPREFKHENRVFRDWAAGLSVVRDATALVEIVDSLEERYGAERLAPVRNAVVELKREREEAARLDVNRFARRLRRARERVDSWPLDESGFDLIAPGMKQSYKLGRKAFSHATSGDSAEEYHECRKRSKDLWYHLRLLDPVSPRGLRSSERALDEMQESLGDDHNLAVLKECAAHAPHRFGGGETMRFLEDAIDAEQYRLRRKAAALGKRVYASQAAGFRSPHTGPLGRVGSSGPEERRAGRFWRAQRRPSRIIRGSGYWPLPFCVAIGFGAVRSSAILTTSRPCPCSPPVTTSVYRRPGVI